MSGPKANTTENGIKGDIIMTKKIEVIIREEKLEIVKEALHKIGIVGMNVM